MREVAIITPNPEQAPADVAVVVPTILRPSLLRAARSVFAQTFAGRIHLLIGIDVPLGDRAVLDKLCEECPPHVMLSVMELGYSTSRRHGGLYTNYYGGALRTILSLCANAPLVAYLDDNDWFAADHVESLCQAIAGRQWAFSHRWIVDPETLWPICPDDWDSVGPGRGINAERFGGFVQPSTLMIDKLACHGMLHLWSLAAFPDGTGEDRLVFDALNRGFTWGTTGRATTFCIATAESVRHDHHVREFESRGIRWVMERPLVAEVEANATTAEEAVRDGRWEAARDASLAALHIHPHHAPSLHRLALSQWRLGVIDAALESIRHAVAVDDLEPRHLDVQAAILLSAGRGGEAMRSMAAVRRRFPGWTGAAS